MTVMYAKQKANLHTYSEEYDYTCYCSDSRNIPEIQNTVSEVVDYEILNSDDEVLFGSATIQIKKGQVIIMNFKNEKFDDEELDDLMDLIISPEDRP